MDASDWRYLAIGLGIGAVIGFVVGIATQDPLYAISVGFALGVVIAAAMASD